LRVIKIVQVVEGPDAVAVAQQLLANVRADEARAAGDEKIHDSTLATAARRVEFSGIEISNLYCDTPAMRILALDHGTKRIGVAVSDETKIIAQPLEYIPAEPFAGFLERLKQLLAEKEVDCILIGMPRNMDGSYGPAAQKVEVFVAALKSAVTVPIKTWDERLTSTMANRVMIQGNVRRDKRKEKVDAMAAAILLQSYLDMGQ